MNQQGAGASAAADSGGPSGLLLAYIGGIRSGKSALAQRRFEGEIDRLGLKAPVHVGTLLAEASDADASLAERLKAHRAARPAAWANVEAGRDLPAAGKRCVQSGHDAVLLDGLGAWAALRLEQPQAAVAELKAFLVLARSARLTVLVLDEVGQGGVPGHPAARAFVDLNGTLNQVACAQADEVWGAQAGLAVKLK